MTIVIILFWLYIVSASLMMFTLAWQIKQLQDAVDEIKFVKHINWEKLLKVEEDDTKYEPTCPRGYTDCVNDPAYIKSADDKWYKKLYGDKAPEEAAEECRQKFMKDPDEKYYCYDDEDK